MRIQNKKYYIKGEEFNSFKAAMREELWKRMFVLGVGISDEIILKNVVLHSQANFHKIYCC